MNKLSSIIELSPIKFHPGENLSAHFHPYEKSTQSKNDEDAPVIKKQKRSLFLEEDKFDFTYKIAIKLLSFKCANRNEVAKARSEAKDLLCAAANNGHIGAMLKLADDLLARLPKDGQTKGVTINCQAEKKEVLELYRRASAAGSIDAKIKLADCILKRMDANTNNTQVIQLYREAISLGSIDAKEKLAKCLSKGIGCKATPENKAEAKLLIETAAKEKFEIHKSKLN